MGRNSLLGSAMYARLLTVSSVRGADDERKRRDGSERVQMDLRADCNRMHGTGGTCWKRRILPGLGGRRRTQTSPAARKKAEILWACGADLGAPTPAPSRSDPLVPAGSAVSVHSVRRARIPDRPTILRLRS